MGQSEFVTAKKKILLQPPAFPQGNTVCQKTNLFLMDFLELEEIAFPVSQIVVWPPVVLQIVIVPV
jgi:hypothetical protein